MRLRGVWLLVVMGLIGSKAAPVRAGLPTVEVRIDTVRVMLGDPFTLTVRLRYRPGEEVRLPRLDKWLSPFAPRPGIAQGPLAVEGVLEQVQRFELRLFELGERQIPPLAVAFIGAAGDTLVRLSDPLDIEVVSARSEEADFLRDIKPPQVVSGGVARWLALLLAMVLLGLVGAVLYRVVRRPRSPASLSCLPIPVDYAAEFSRIAGLGLVEKGDFKTYYSLLADTLRRYLEQCFGIETMERTTSEIVAALQKLELESTLLRPLEEYLQVADLVKFARFIPPLERARQAPEEGVALVRAGERFVQTVRLGQEADSEKRGRQERVVVTP